MLKNKLLNFNYYNYILLECLKLLTEQRRDVLRAIQDAMLDKETLFISYRKPDGRIYDYEVEPYEIKWKGDTLCFFGYDVDEDTIKCFNIRRVLRAEPTGEEFRPRWRIKVIGL